jgi:MYND finger
MEAKSVLKKLKLSSTLTSSIFESIEYYYDKSPWKVIPGPWIMRITKAGLDDRYCQILGCQDKNQRGLAIYASLDDVFVLGSARPLPKALALMFQNGQKSLPTLSKTNGFSMETMNKSDVDFLEFGMNVVADFVTEAAKQQLDGMDPMLVFQTLTYGNESFPCIQSVETTHGVVNIKMGLIPTHISLMHTRTGGSIKVEKITPLDSNLKVCIVCRKTESDCMSTTGKSLQKCSACSSSSERYCSRECQKIDWKRHKQTCQPAQG